MEVQLSGFYLVDDLDRLLSELQPAIAVAKAQPIRIDLTRVAFIGPTCLAVLLAALKSLQADQLNAPGSVVLPPHDSRTRADLYRMDFFRVLAGAEDPAAAGREAGERPCRDFSTHEEAVVVARELAAAIAERVDMDRPSQLAIQVLLSELAENVVFHASSELGAFAVAQSWRNRPETEVAIVDLGVGIRGSLTKNPRYTGILTDLEAIQTAMKPLVTATPDRNSGYGLAFAQGLLRANGGILRVRSGEAAVYAGAVDATGISPLSYPGTVIALTMRTDRPLDQASGWREVGPSLQGDEE